MILTKSACGIDFRPNIKVIGNEKENLEVVVSETSLLIENSEFFKVYSNPSTMCSSIDSHVENESHDVLSNKNTTSDINSFEFQSQYFLEQ